MNKAEFESSTRAARRAHRIAYEEEWKELIANREEIKKAGSFGIKWTLVTPDSVDMKTFSGTKKELKYAVEKLYENNGRDFNPDMMPTPGMLRNYGKEYALHSQGIYYRSFFSEDLVTCGRKIWTPSLSSNDEESPGNLGRQFRAKVFADHSRNNETWCKSEYVWEADAWSDVFRPMRDDPCLTMDKHDYFTLIPETDPVLCKPTGKPTFSKRTPDATFGLATFIDREFATPGWTSDLLCERLEWLMLHPKYGLFSDPKRTETDLVFPFMVYEAKGWNGDCRVARQQACSAAAYYLDMLDELVRRPGPVGTPRPYQTSTSHHYQVFALTSFGAYWHLLVGYRRPRSSAEHAGVKGMSDTVYIFQKLWSGYVVDKNAALELLSLVDQIHLWARTEYRAFVLAHLRPWHSLCQKNYLLEWDSKYDLGEEKKRKRTCKPGDFMLPSWVRNMDEFSQRKLQHRAKLSLAEASVDHHLLVEGSGSEIKCTKDGCGFIAGSIPALFDHLQTYHGEEESRVASLRWCFRQLEVIEDIEDRARDGVMATGHLWPGVLKRRLDNAPPGFEVDTDFKNVVTYDRLKRKRVKLLTD